MVQTAQYLVMETLLQHLQTYYRKKRILNIVYLDSQVDAAEETNISPPIWPRFLIQLFLWVGPSLLLSSLVAVLPISIPTGVAAVLLLVTSWVSVELTDLIWLHYYQYIKLILNAVSILLVLLVAVALSLVLFNPEVNQRLIEWHTEVNQTLQRNAAISVQILGVAKGENWALLQNANGTLQPVTATQARGVCHTRLGGNWQLPKSQQLQTLRPHPQLSRRIYVWTITASNELLLKSLAQSPSQSSSTSVGYKQYSLYPVLCYNAKP